ncbi:MAG: peptidoglycan-binding protein [Hyphomicrobiales bacterium]|nr:peptidoglycan-binding protein [Hyphomicrobiales bacterium]
MARRSAHQGEPAEPDFEDDDIVAGSRMMDRLVDRIMDNPAMSGGFLVMALTAAAVVSNAVFLQKARHPEPFFMTRPAETPGDASDVSPNLPVPRPRSDAASSEADSMSAEVAVPLPSPAPPPVVSDAVIVRELQEKLAEQGLYKGKIDGISGSRTRSAIVAYQESQGLTVTGRPSTLVLDHINTASVRGPDPGTATKPVEVDPVDPVDPQPVEAVVPAALEPAVDSAPTAADIARRNRYLAVQRALNQIGYGPVPEDGLPGDDVDNAIRRFELDNGLPITGAPDDGVVDRLVAIGAMTST